MSRVAAFARFWWDFVVGDDWRVAAALIVAIGITAGLAHGSIAAWWVMPVAVPLVLYSSLRRATRPPSRRQTATPAEPDVLE
jgi:hypothetical protein